MSFRVFEPSYDFIDERLNVFLGDRLSSVIAQVDGPLRIALLLYVVLYGIALGGMNGTFYAAIDRIPLAIAVTIEFLGPLVLAAVLSRRARDIAWVLVAAAAVAVLGFSKSPETSASDGGRESSASGSLPSSARRGSKR